MVPAQAGFLIVIDLQLRQQLRRNGQNCQEFHLSQKEGNQQHEGLFHFTEKGCHVINTRGEGRYQEKQIRNIKIFL